MFLQYGNQHIDIDKIESFTADPENSPNLHLIMDSKTPYTLYYSNQSELIDAINLIKQSREKD